MVGYLVFLAICFGVVAVTIFNDDSDLECY